MKTIVTGKNTNLIVVVVDSLQSNPLELFNLSQEEVLSLHFTNYIAFRADQPFTSFNCKELGVRVFAEIDPENEPLKVCNLTFESLRLFLNKPLRMDSRAVEMLVKLWRCSNVDS